MKRFLISLILSFLLFACGGSEFDEGEDYGDLLDTEEGLILTEEEHVGAWGRSDCTLCHNLENIHLTNRTDVPLDIEAIHDQAIAEGVAGCADCHGTNGVP